MHQTRSGPHCHGMVSHVGIGTVRGERTGNNITASSVDVAFECEALQERQELINVLESLPTVVADESMDTSDD
jgi:hypothetical protein